MGHDMGQEEGAPMKNEEMSADPQPEAEGSPAEQPEASEEPARENGASAEVTVEDLAALDSDEGLNVGQEQVLELISYIVVNLVEHPDEVTIDIVRKQGRDVYQVRVHEEDLGKVIGKGGQTARALRVLLMAVSARTDQRIGLEIVE